MVLCIKWVDNDDTITDSIVQECDSDKSRGGGGDQLQCARLPQALSHLDEGGISWCVDNSYFHFSFINNSDDVWSRQKLFWLNHGEGGGTQFRSEKLIVWTLKRKGCCQVKRPAQTTCHSQTAWWGDIGWQVSSSKIPSRMIKIWSLKSCFDSMMTFSGG